MRYQVEDTEVAVVVEAAVVVDSSSAAAVDVEIACHRGCEVTSCSDAATLFAEAAEHYYTCSCLVHL